MIWTQLPWINRDMVVLLSQMRRQLRRARAKSGECRGGAASRSAVKKQTLAGRFDGEN